VSIGGRLRVRSNAGLAFTSENQTEVVRWHIDDLGQHESGAGRKLGHHLKVAKTPLGIVRTKIRIEPLITHRRVTTEATVRSV